MTSVLHIMNLRETSWHAPFSGAENYLLDLLPALRGAGMRVEFCVLLESMGPTIQRMIADLESRGITVRCFPYRRLIDPRCIAALSRHLRKRRGWIVHTHLDPGDVTGKIASFLTGCRPVISTVSTCEQYHLSWKWQFVLRALDRVTTKHIAVSESVREHLVTLEGVSPSKVTLIRYGLHEPQMIENRTALRSRLGLPEDQYIVGFVGRLVAQKNVDVLVRAMSRLRDILCVIVGSGHLRKRLENLAAGSDNIRFLGHQPEAKSLMPAFDVLCLPSRWEGMPLVAVEAMLRRVPVVGSTVAPVREVLGNGQLGLLFDPDDVEGLAAALSAARSAGPKIAQRAYEYAHEHYTVDRMIEQTVGFYETLNTNDG